MLGNIVNQARRNTDSEDKTTLNVKIVWFGDSVCNE